MKPEIYYVNKNSHIENVAALVRLQIPRAEKNGTTAMDQLRLRAIEFISLVPDERDEYTDTVWVQNWKTIYNRISESIRDVKEIGDYRLDTKRRELSSVAKALLGSRKAVYWL